MMRAEPQLGQGDARRPVAQADPRCSLVAGAGVVMLCFGFP